LYQTNEFLCIYLHFKQSGTAVVFYTPASVTEAGVFCSSKIRILMNIINFKVKNIKIDIWRNEK